ncbi:hypothetical protein FRB93_009118 [Tulasnella sp. JGI-2019a]|nr:hypothetical protein FRB93_009118 [Tulasnella sp. JGI-2019a]
MPPPAPVVEEEEQNLSGPSKKTKSKRKTRAPAAKDLVSNPTMVTVAETSTAPAPDTLQGQYPPAPPFTFSTPGTYALPPSSNSGFNPWSHLPQPQWPSPVIVGSSLHVHHEQHAPQTQQNQTRPPPTPPQPQHPLAHQQHPHQHQPQQSPIQPAQLHPQVMHLSHFRLPHQSHPQQQPQPQQQQQHPMHPFAAGPVTTPAAALAVARGHWYGVNPAAGMPPSPLPALSQLAAPPATNQASRPSNSLNHQTQQPQPQPQPHPQQPQQQQGTSNVLPSQPLSFQQTFNPAGWSTQPTSADGVYYPHQSFGSPFPDTQYIVGARPNPVPQAPPVTPVAAPSPLRQVQDITPQVDEEHEPVTTNIDAAVDRRGRKRKRASEGTPSSKPKSKYVAPPTTDLTALVPALAPPRRSPTPPTRVLKSTYGGNLFTVEDVEYMKNYIDWCVDMGLVLSLREICERLAVKAPHHTFYSWRRYCNKHKIKLGCYQMAPAEIDPDDANNDEDPSMDLDDIDVEQSQGHTEETSYQGGGEHDSLQRLPSVQQIIGVGAGASASHIQMQQQTPLSIHPHQPQHRAVVLRESTSSDIHPHSHSHSHNRNRSQLDNHRERSPTPPRTLHRSTTGKGIAYSDEDVAFLVKYLNYRRAKDSSLNMQLFWNDVASKAPHHSRASWLKYWRRHRHEIEVGDDDSDNAPAAGGANGSGNVTMQVPSTNPGGVPAHPKRSRYSHEDDILLAKFWATDPQGTSDKLFQDFARIHPHHPWKGWQEHHRLHKAQIDHFIKIQKEGTDLDSIPGPPTEEKSTSGKGKGSGKGRKRKETE